MSDYLFIFTEDPAELLHIVHSDFLYAVVLAVIGSITSAIGCITMEVSKKN